MEGDCQATWSRDSALMEEEHPLYLELDCSLRRDNAVFNCALSLLLLLKQSLHVF